MCRAHIGSLYNLVTAHALFHANPEKAYKYKSGPSVSQQELKGIAKHIKWEV